MKGIFIAGGPGSGKSVQWKMLAESFNFLHCCLGDHIREEMTKETENAYIIKAALEEGKLIPSNISVSLLKKELLSNEDLGKIWLIDGFPRSIENLNEWNKQWPDLLENQHMIYIKVPDKIMLERIAQRSIQEGRQFDTEEISLKRIQSFYDDTYEVIQYFIDEGIWTVINGNQSKEMVYSELWETLKLY